MDQTQSTLPAIDKQEKPGGRKDGSGTAAVIKTQPLKESIQELIRLFDKNATVRDDLNKAIKKVAEKTGVLSSVVRRLVAARAGDKFDEKKNEVEQLGIVFDEVGEDPKH